MKDRKGNKSINLWLFFSIVFAYYFKEERNVTMHQWNMCSFRGKIFFVLIAISFKSVSDRRMHHLMINKSTSDLFLFKNDCLKVSNISRGIFNDRFRSFSYKSIKRWIFIKKLNAIKKNMC